MWKGCAIPGSRAPVEAVGSGSSGAIRAAIRAALLCEEAPRKAPRPRCWPDRRLGAPGSRSGAGDSRGPELQGLQSSDHAAFGFVWKSWRGVKTRNTTGVPSENLH